MFLETLGKIIDKKYKTVEELAQDFIVERHDDDPSSLHIFIDAEKPLINRPSHKNNPRLAARLEANELPSFEIKSKDGIIFCSPSIHENDKGITGVWPYCIVGIFDGAVTLTTTQIDMLEKLISECCDKYGIINQKQTTEQHNIKPSMASGLMKPGVNVNEGENRHVAMLSIMSSLCIHYPDLPEESILGMTMVRNNEICNPPLSKEELRYILHHQCKPWATKKLEDKAVPEEIGLEINEDKVKKIAEIIALCGIEVVKGVCKLFDTYGYSRSVSISLIERTVNDENERRYMIETLGQLTDVDLYDVLKPEDADNVYIHIVKTLLGDNKKGASLSDYEKEQIIGSIAGLDHSVLLHSLCGTLCENKVSLESTLQIIDIIEQGHTKDVCDVYLRARKGEIIVGLAGLSSTLMGLVGEERADEIINNIKGIFKRHNSSYLSQLPEDVRQELQPHVTELLSHIPLKLVVANLVEKQIMYAGLSKPNDNIQHLQYSDVIINAVPTTIIKYLNPIATSATASIPPKYEGVFETPTGSRLKFGPYTLEDTLSMLKQNGVAYNAREAEKVLPAIIHAFYRDGRMVVKHETDVAGFYWDNGKVIACNVNIQDYTEQQVSDCADILNMLVSKEKDGGQVLATIIKWSMIAPFSYIIKQKKVKDKYVNWVYEYGHTKVGKTTKAEIGLEIWRKNDSEHNTGFTSVSTIARMGYAIGHDTFPILADEVPDLNDPKLPGALRELVEAIKNAVQNETFRSKVEGTRRSEYKHYPALCPFIFAGNPFPPNDPAFQRRMITKYFTPSDELDDNSVKEYDRLLKEHKYKLGTLGDFMAKYILANPEALNKDWNVLSTEVLETFYKTANKEMPEWIYQMLPHTQIQDIIENQDQVVRGFFFKVVTETYNRTLRIYYENSHDLMDKEFGDRLHFCLDKDLLSFLKPRKEDVLILSDVVKELKNQRIDHISSLEQLCSTLGGKHGQHKLGETNFKSIAIGFDKLVEFIDPLCKDKKKVALL
jgi:hypothetical protein